MGTINGCWDEFNLWLESQGLHDEEAPIEDEEEIWIGQSHPSEWESGNVPEPPPNFVGEYWRTDD